MIKQFLTSALVLTAVSANPVFAANDSDSSKSTQVVVKMTSSITKLIIQGNADVILVSDETADITIDGDEATTKSVRLAYQNNQLEIIAPEYKTRNKPVIRIPAPQLQRLEINGDGEIRSESFLRSTQLDVFVNGACNFHIRSKGKIVINAAPDFHLQYFKNQKI